MFGLLKFVIWVAGIIAIVIFTLGYFGYEINTSYFKERRAACQERLARCSKELINQETRNVRCSFSCVNFKLIIKKKNL